MFFIYETRITEVYKFFFAINNGAIKNTVGGLVLDSKMDFGFIKLVLIV